MSSLIYGVVIADVLASSAHADVRAVLGKKLAAVSEKHLRQKLIRLPYTVTAGDEFQTITTALPSIPGLLLDLRAAIQPLSLHVGIGIGNVADRIQPPVNHLNGEAFQFARLAVENVKKNGFFKFEVLTAFASHNEPFNQTINLLYGLNDTLMLQVTAKQWGTIRHFLDQPALERSAKRLRLDISTVSRSLKRGFYWQMAETAKLAGKLLERTFQQSAEHALVRRS